MTKRGPSGIVQAPRRLEGWSPPGPRPAGAQGRAELSPAADEDLCLLSGDWRIFQKQRGHRWSLDDLVTAWVAAGALEEARLASGAGGAVWAGEGLRALDLGCGLGSVLMMIAWRFPAAEVVGVEAQPERAAMARRSLAYNGAAERCRVFDGDLRELGAREEAALSGPFALITGTPPYFPRGAGTESGTPQVAPCRFELRGGVEDYLAAALPRLAPGGRLVVCTAALEEARVAAAVAALGLVHVTHWDIVPREGKPVLVMVDVLARGAASGASGPGNPSIPGLGSMGALEATTGGEVRAPAVRRLTVRDRDHAWTPEFRAVRAAMGMPATTPAGR